MNKQGKGKIEYLDYTWNPVTGCNHPCKDQYCYAKTIANRFGHISINEACMFKDKPEIYDLYYPVTYSRDCGHDSMGNPVEKDYIDPYPAGFAPTFHRYRLDEPVKKKKPSIVGVVYMGDLFGEWIPDEWIQEVFTACEAAPQYKYMFLTKNPERYGKINGWDHRYNWNIAKENWWFGTTITGNNDIGKLRWLPYGHTNTFISIEPLQGEVDLSFYIPKATTRWKCSYCGFHDSVYQNSCVNCGNIGSYSGSFRKRPIDWLIIGQQTGSGAKLPKTEWVKSIIDQARAAGIPIFVKSPLFQQFPIQEWPEGLR